VEKAVQIEDNVDEEEVIVKNNLRKQYNSVDQHISMLSIQLKLKLGRQRMLIH
jgi:hypothetical protein